VSGVTVSVVTPFYNTARYLGGCIESVLGQTLGDFEYLLVDNQSDDGSAEIAQEYARKDSRIRVLRNEAFVKQVPNYNGALARIGGESRWVKLVQADDSIMPDCLRLMVEVGQSDERIGLVSAYWMHDDRPKGEGVPFGCRRLPGREACRLMLLTRAFLLGSPTSVLYRADLVRRRKPFFAEGRNHEDTEAGYELLLESDLGFVHQVLSYLRSDDASLFGSSRSYNPGMLDYLTMIERYGPQVLSAEELSRLRKQEWASYKAFLGTSLLRRREPGFWRYHEQGLGQLGQRLSTPSLFAWAALRLVRLALDPIGTFTKL
jgi:glycosyltransferase involved in cell wall biosynthesis